MIINSIVLQNKKVLPIESISNIEITSDISSLFLLAELSFKDPTKIYFNRIFSGMPVNIIFSEEDEIINIPFNVVYFEKGNTLEEIKLILVHSWILNNKDKKTLAYKGTVSEIIKKGLSEIEYKNFKENISEVQSSASIRYRISESLPSFFKKIIKYGSIEGFPSYLCMHLNNTLNFFNVGEKLSESNPIYVSLGDNEAPNNLKKLQKIKSDVYSFRSNIAQSVSSLELNTAAPNFKTTGKPLKNITINNAEIWGNQSVLTSKGKVEYIPWFQNPLDFVSSKIFENFEKNKETYSVKFTLPYLSLNKLQPGDIFKILLPLAPVSGTISNNDLNLGEGSYMVTKASIVISGTLSMTSITAIPVPIKN